MLPGNWEEIESALSLLRQGFAFVREGWRRRDRIRAKAALTVEAARREWRILNAMPPVARFAVGAWYINFVACIGWDIAIGPPPLLLTMYPVLGLILLTTYAAYLGAKLTGRRVKKTVWQK